MSIACTWEAPFRASCVASRPVPQPTSRQRAPSPIPWVYRCFQIRKLPGGRHEHVGLDDQLGHRQRIQAPAALVEPRLELYALAQRGGAGLIGRSRRRRWRACARAGCRRGASWPRRCGAGRTPQQPPMMSAPSSRQRGGQLGELVAADAVVERPARLGVVAEVRVDAQRQVGEVPQPGQHSRDVVGRDAVDEQRRHAHLLEAAGGAAEEVALGAAPVLAEHAAETVPAAAEAEPDRVAAVHQRLHRLERELVDQRHRLEQDEVGRLVLEYTREELEALQALLVRDLAVKAEGHRRVSRPTDVGGGLPGQAYRPARQLHPIGRRGARRTVRRRSWRSGCPKCRSRSRRSPPLRSCGARA